MPLLMFTFLGFAELGRAYAVAFGWQRGADVLAQSAAVMSAQDPDWRPAWNVMAAEEEARAGCERADVRFLDGTQPGGRVEVTWTCQYTGLLYNGLTFPPVDIASVAVIPVVP